MISRHASLPLFLFQLAGLFAVSAVHAADLGDGGMKDVPVPAVAERNWGGLYLGAHAGVAWGSFNPTEVDPAFAVLIDEELDHDPDGGVLGLHVGYNLQRRDWVFGIEADVSATNVEGELLYDFVIGGADTFTDSQTFELNYMATVRGRIGFDTGGMLLFVTGGWAVADVDTTFTATNVGPGPLPDGTISGAVSETHGGWVVGGGVDAMLRDGVSLRIEYLYADFGEETHTPVPGIPGEPFDLDMHIVRAGLSYHF
jgi:outer membrane immunogenic protein